MNLAKTVFPLATRKRCQELLEEIDPRPPPGMSLPQCKPDGSWREKQCHESIGYCWCVDENGEEIPGTRKNVRIKDTVICVPGSQN